MRVAFVVSTFAAGGLERCAANLIHGLGGTEIEPIVVSLTRSGSAAEWLPAETPVIALDKPDGNDLKVVQRLADCLRDYNIEILQSHNWGSLIESTLACRRVKGMLHVHAQHGLEIESSKVRGLKRFLRRQAFRWGMNRADAVVAIAACVQDWIVNDLRVPASKVQLLENGVANSTLSDDSDFSVRDRIGIGEDARILGAVCRLVEVKDLPLAMDALQLLAKSDDDVHLVVVGEGPCRQQLEQHAQQLGIAGRVHLVGHQLNVDQWLRSFDLLLNTSYSEAMNLGILEAMAAGCPVVAVDVGDNRRLVLDPEAPVGRVVTPRTAEALASTISDLLSNQAELDRFAAHGRSRFQSSYTLERMCQRYASLYRRLTSANEVPMTSHQPPSVAESSR